MDALMHRERPAGDTLDYNCITQDESRESVEQKIDGVFLSYLSENPEEMVEYSVERFKRAILDGCGRRELVGIVGVNRYEVRLKWVLQDREAVRAFLQNLHPDSKDSIDYYALD